MMIRDSGLLFGPPRIHTVIKACMGSNA